MIFAICLRARRGRMDGVLMLVDDRDEAEAIAMELQRNGHDVEVREYVTPDESV
jgi:hypothetical protein